MGTRLVSVCLLAVTVTVSCAHPTTCILSAAPGHNVGGCNGCATTVGSTGRSYKLLAVNSKTDFSAVVEFVSSVFPSRSSDVCENNVHCNGVLGVVGDLDSRTASIIHILASRSNLSITLVAAVAPSTFLPVTDLALTNLLDMRPLSHYIEGLAWFLQVLKWTRVGLVTDDSYYYQFAAELLQKRLLQDPSNTVTPFVRIGDKDGMQVFREYNTRIIIVLVNSSASCSILKQAQQHNYTWPDYALVMLDFEMPACPMEGMILVKERANDYSQESGCFGLDRNHCANNSSLPSDSIVAVHLADTLDFHNDTFHGCNGQVRIRNNKRLIDLVFVHMSTNTSGLDVAYYNSQLQQLILLPNTPLTTGTRPRGDTLVIPYQPSPLHVVVVITTYILCTVFITSVLVLYVCFRKEPEIKSTSVTVSLCMFVGCYFILLIVPIVLIDALPRPYPQGLADFFCNLIAWLSLGCPSTLIMATIFIKMLRIYMVFHTPYTLKWRLFSNPFLFLYIILLTSPTILILIIWSGYDPLVSIVIETSYKNHTIQVDRCLSRNIAVWLGFEMFYISAMAVALSILAIKTSKIRLKNFRDAKETSAFAFVTVYVTILGFIYYLFFYLTAPDFTASTARKFTIYLAHIIIPMACQFFLFVPKVYPPIKRCILKKSV